MYQGKARNYSLVNNIIGFLLELLVVIGLSVLIALSVLGG